MRLRRARSTLREMRRLSALDAQAAGRWKDSRTAVHREEEANDGSSSPPQQT